MDTGLARERAQLPHLRFSAVSEAERLELFETIVRADPDLMRLLWILRALALPGWRLVAGCLYQTVWNTLSGRPRGTGIMDYDVAYFDDGDLSWEAEDAVIATVAAALGDFPGDVEVRNQARVHLWFEQRFGSPYSPLRSTEEGIDRYATVAHMVGVRLEPDDTLDIYAPQGLGDIFNFILRPNYALDNGPTHARKGARLISIWPELTVEPWEAARAGTAGA